MNTNDQLRQYFSTFMSETHIAFMEASNEGLLGKLIKSHARQREIISRNIAACSVSAKDIQKIDTAYTLYATKKQQLDTLVSNLQNDITPVLVDNQYTRINAARITKQLPQIHKLSVAVNKAFAAWQKVQQDVSLKNNNDT